MNANFLIKIEIFYPIGIHLLLLRFGRNKRPGVRLVYFLSLKNLLQGAVNVVDLLNTGLGNAAQSLTIAPLPAQVHSL